MSYLRPFHRLVMIGTLYTDIFNVTCSFGSAGVDAPAVTSSLLTNVASAVSGWWNQSLPALGTGISITPAAKLTSIKLNRINTAGHYQDATAMEHVYATPIAGVGTNGVVPQLSLVVSLRGAAPRSKAGKGRMYFPPSSAATNPLDNSTGQVSVANATNHANGVKNLLALIDAVYLAQGITAVAGIASNAGSGAFQAVDEIQVGRVVDTMRSRRNKLKEEPVVIDAA